MKRFFCVLMIIASCIIITSGCSGKKDTSLSVAVAKENRNVSYDMSSVYTKGNFSYIPINMRLDFSGINPDPRNKVIPRVINVLNAFEKSHPELEITGWELDKWEDTDRVIVDGIWVSHKAKEPQK